MMRRVTVNKTTKTHSLPEPMRIPIVVIKVYATVDAAQFLDNAGVDDYDES